jgi:hypothetical protein
MPRQMLIGGAMGAPPEIPPESFVTSKQSKPGENGYIIVCDLLLRTMPWGAWDELGRQNRRMKVTWDRVNNRVVILLDPTGTRRFGKMPGWISEGVAVRESLAEGMISGRQPARWEENVTVDGKVVFGWSLVAYPKVVKGGPVAGDVEW